jgi:hypothetical protein
MTDPTRYDHALADVFGGVASDGYDPAEPHCPDFPDCREERYVRDLLASVKAGEPVGRWVSGCRACEALAKESSR